jgi:transposase
MAIYLTQHHMLPIARTAQILGALTGEPIAPSTVQNTIAGAAAMLVPAVELIKNAVGSSPVVHADETGLRVAGGLHWMHVAVTEELTFAGSHPKRGIEGIAHFGVLDQVQGTIVHDGFGPYKDLTCLHGLCNAHHLRELQFEAETTGQLWSFDLIKVLLEANAEVRKTHSPLPAYQLEQLQRRYRTLLDEGERLNPPRDPAGGRRGRIKQSTATCLLRRLRHLEEDVLRFAVDPDVPFTNNLAERSIRMPKVKQKISGCFRTAAGAQAFCTIRSYLATLAKQKRDLLGSLILALQGNTPNPCFG